MTPTLLSPGRIGSLSLRNRILMAPMGSNLCEPDGQLGPRIVHYYAERARGGAAMLVVGSVGVSWPRGATNPRQVAFSDDRFAPGMRALVERVHAHGAALALQLHHGGRSAVNDIAAGLPLFVASKPVFRGANDRAAAMSRAEAELAGGMRRGRMPIFEPASEAGIRALIEDFAAAAARAREAGVDGVEVHAAHGYAIAGFLSPAWNTRTDEWGGSHEGRARLLRETLRAIRARVGADYPVWCRLDAIEFRVAGGIALEDALRTARIAEAAGADAIHVSAYSDGSSGVGFTDGPLVHAEERYVDFARAMKRAVTIPVIGVGRIEIERADQLLGEGAMDFVALGRKLLADPELPAKLAQGRRDAIRPCIYGYRCVGEVSLGRGLFCGVNPFTGREHEYAPALPLSPQSPGHAPSLAPAARARRVLVVGGGIAGLETARLTALRGHAVVLAERRDRLGDGSEDGPELDRPLARYSRWLRGQVADQAIDVRLATAVDVDWVKRLAPDAVVLAVGRASAPRGFPIEDGAIVLDPSALRTEAQLAARLGPTLGAIGSQASPREDARTGRTVVVLGSGARALAIAERVAQRGPAVLVLEEGETPALELALPLRWRKLHELRELGVELASRIDLVAIRAGALEYRDADGRSTVVPAELVVDARAIVASPEGDGVAAVAGPRAIVGLEALGDACSEIHRVGDCAGGTSVEEAVRGAFEVAARL
ncbi:MAG: FAD-dependent oxidoreductase [Deltaproteobacteria bacterium]|nr:FAD-dependent oxidoreductase [Deltaproteobacteria bacterium]